MKNMIELSFIVPVYNVEPYIEECLRSILSCSFENKELIIINDGSTDNSESIILSFVKNYSFIKYIKKENEGMSSARNAGLEVANGKYCLFIDSDDVIDSNYIFELIKTAEESNAQIVVGDYYEFSTNHKKLRLDKSNFSGSLINETDRLKKILNLEISFAIWNKLYLTSFLKNNNLKFKVGYWFEDLDFVFKCFYKANEIKKANCIFYGYRQRPGSIMKSISLKILDKIIIANNLKAFLIAENKYEIYKNDFQILYLKMAFSVLYSCFRYKNNKNKLNAQKVAATIISDSNFNHFIGEPLVNRKYLSLFEKLLYYIFHFRLGKIILILYK